jgi:hypothetical protein
MRECVFERVFADAIQKDVAVIEKTADYEPCIDSKRMGEGLRYSTTHNQKKRPLTDRYGPGR